MTAPSLLATTVVAARVPNEDADALRNCAARTGVSSSRVLARLLREACRHHPDLFEPLPVGSGAEGPGTSG